MLKHLNQNEGTIKSVTPITNRITIEYKEGNSNRSAELIVINNAVLN